MKILDLFCGGGIAATGLVQFGDVTGYDVRPQKHYPGTFKQADFREADVSKFDFIWASPPCQGYSCVTPKSHKVLHPKLIPEVRELCRRSGKPYVIENVPGSELRENVRLCGCMFGLPIERVRLFESNFYIRQPKHIEHRKGPPCVRIYGHVKGNIREWRRIMGVGENSHFGRAELAQGVPVAYVIYIMGEFRKNPSLNMYFTPGSSLFR